MDGHIGVGPGIGFTCSLFDDDVASIGVKSSWLLDLKAKFEWDLAKAASGALWESFNGSEAELGDIWKTELVVDWILLGEPYKWPFTMPGTLGKGTLLPKIENLKVENGIVSYSVSSRVCLQGEYGIQLYDRDGNKIGEPLYYNDKPSEDLLPKTISIPVDAANGKTYTACPVFNLFGLVVVNKQQSVKITDNKPVDNNGLTEDINELVPPDILEKLRDELGIPIYGGNTPPNIEGTYLASPMRKVRTNYNESIFANYGYDIEHTFYNQDAGNLTVHVNRLFFNLFGFVDNSNAREEGVGAFIVGHDNVFSIFIQTDYVKDNGYKCLDANVISGELVDGGIRNLQEASIVVDDYGDPGNIFLEIGQGRVMGDKDGFSPKVKGSTKSSITRSSILKGGTPMIMRAAQ
jgi:hypothetical protein